MAVPVIFTQTKYPLTKLPTTLPAINPNPYADLFAVFNTLRAMWGYLDQNFAALESSIGGFITEAPIDGQIYGRKDAGWVLAGGGGLVTWGSITGTLSAQTDLAAALAAKIGEAPNDGQQYARQSLGWSVVTGGGGGSTPVPWSTWTAPPTTSWSWVNQGGASITSAGTYQYLAGTATAVSDTRFRGRARNLSSSSNYTVTACFKVNSALVNYYGAGLFLYDSATTANVIFSIRAINGLWSVDLSYNPNPNNYGGTYLSGTVVASDYYWLRIVDDGTNRICYFSTDGFNFWQVHTVSRTSYIIPDQIGFGLHCDDRTTSGYIPSVTLWSWTQ